MAATTVFNRYATSYDQGRRKLIPCFDAFYAAAVAALDLDPALPVRVLDLGAGTGILCAFILTAFPKASFTLVDGSREMLEVARKRFADRPDRFDYLVADYSEKLPEGPFHAVVSALSIHHLEEPEKLALFNEAFALLEPGGIFVNADQVLGETSEETAAFKKGWVEEVTALGTTGEELAAAFERMKADRMSPLSVQLDGLRQAGFRRVDRLFQEKSFVVYRGVKP